MGPLATFSARINLCYVMGLISPAIWADLHQFRKIGNAFAHGPMDLTFDDQSVADRCALLRHDFLQERLPARKKFMRVAMGVLGYIHAATKTSGRIEPAPDIQFDAEHLEQAQRIRRAIEQLDQES